MIAGVLAFIGSIVCLIIAVAHSLDEHNDKIAMKKDLAKLRDLKRVIGLIDETVDELGDLINLADSLSYRLIGAHNRCRDMGLEVDSEEVNYAFDLQSRIPEYKRTKKRLAQTYIQVESKWLE